MGFGNDRDSATPIADPVSGINFGGDWASPPPPAPDAVTGAAPATQPGEGLPRPTYTPISDQDIADHRLLVDYLKRKVPHVSDYEARVWSARVVANPKDVDQELLTYARRERDKRDQAKSRDAYVADLMRRRALMERAQPNAVLLAPGLPTARGLQASEGLYTQGEQLPGEDPHAGPSRADVLAGRAAGFVTPEQGELLRRKAIMADPQAHFIAATAPTAAAISQKFKIDPSSAALITAQLYGAKPYSTEPSPAENAVQVGNVLKNLIGAPDQMTGRRR